MEVYVDTVNRSMLKDGAPHARIGMDTKYVVRLAATKSRPGRILAEFSTLKLAEEYAALATDRRWGLAQMA